MAANDDKSLVDLINNEFPKGDLREHLGYLKAAYAKHQKWQNRLSGAIDKMVTASGMALLLFAANALWAEVRRFFGAH